MVPYVDLNQLKSLILRELKNLKGNDRLSVSNLKEGEQLSLALAKSQQSKHQEIDMNDMRWHGGGDTVGAGDNITIETVDGVKIISATGGGGNPSAPDTSIQFNNNGGFGGTAKFRWTVGGNESLYLGAVGDPSSIRTPAGTASDGVALDILTGTGDTDQDGGQLNITPGDGNGTGRGGALDVRSGAGGNEGNGGAMSFTAGDGGNTSGDGGALEFTAGSSFGADGGSVTINAGEAPALATGGSIELLTGEGGQGGDLTLIANGSIDNGNQGGSVYINAGAGTGGAGGDITLLAGESLALDSGGDVQISAGNGAVQGGRVFLGGGFGPIGGEISITPGSAGNDNGAHILLTGGSYAGVGTKQGDVIINDSGDSTTRSGGFMRIPVTNGIPTGTPGIEGNNAPLVFDYANNRLYVYNPISGGNWYKVQLT